ncbi:hypothetical protein V6N11_049548 [Hibiscus sabdariffa]|uniref:RNase H type-1 domain-containing protein n=1 Tax=Hibiscus sabdariffa TaxID=183260 RepID=A0ABR2NMM5_9ROSI
MTTLDSKQFQFLIILLWNVWNRRNRWVHQNQLLPTKMVAEYAQLLAGEYQAANDQRSQVEQVTSATQRWSKPEEGVVKINVDGAWVQERRLAAIGVVVRDHHGMVIDARASKVEGSHTAETVEACAFAEGAKLAKENGYQRFQLEGDAAAIVAKLNAHTLDRSVAASYLQEAWQTLKACPGSVVQHIGRNCNRVAHTLAHWQINALESFNFDYVLPTEVMDIVLDDAIYS